MLFDVVWILVSIYMWGQDTDSEAMSLEGIQGAKKIIMYTSFANILLKVEQKNYIGCCYNNVVYTKKRRIT